VRVRGESWNWFGTGDAGEYTFAGVLLRAGMQQGKKAGKIGWRFEVAAPLLLGLPDDAVRPAPAGQLGVGAAYWLANDSSRNAAGLFIKQAFVHVGPLKAGRFEFVEGMEIVPANPRLATLRRERIAHRLVGNFGWSHVQRSFDGAQLLHKGLTAALLRPTRGVFSVKGMDQLDVTAAYASYGNRAAENGRHDWRIFALGYDDDREDHINVKILTLGAHYLRVADLDDARVDVAGWGVLQRGDWGALDHVAHAFAIEAGIQAGVPSNPWLRAGYMRSSGDADPADDRHGTFFAPLPTPRAYARFPFFNSMNLEDAFISLNLQPDARSSVRIEAHRLRLGDAADGWYAGGGPFEAASFGVGARPSGGAADLGTLLDASASFRWSARLSANAYIGRSLGNGAAAGSYDSDDATLGYVELEWRY
jgi:hypothetical protein